MSPSLVVLGAGGAIETAERGNTALALHAGASAVLIDCPGAVAQKLRRAGIDALALEALVITHGHPDHLAGLPSLIHNLWMLHRTVPLPVFAPGEDLPRIERLLEIFNLVRRAAFLDPRPLPRSPASLFFDWPGGGRLHSHPVDHGPPAFAIRWEPPGGGIVLYSTDTRPVEALAEFGRGAALFVHEATFADEEAGRALESGHSTPGQAGRLAGLAGAGRLLLVHLTDTADPARWVAEAQKFFAGPVEVPADGTTYVVP